MKMIESLILNVVCTFSASAEESQQTKQSEKVFYGSHLVPKTLLPSTYRFQFNS